VCRKFPETLPLLDDSPPNPNHKPNPNSYPDTNPNATDPTLTLLSPFPTLTLTEQGRGNVRGGMS